MNPFIAVLFASMIGGPGNTMRARLERTYGDLPDPKHHILRASPLKDKSGMFLIHWRDARGEEAFKTNYGLGSRIILTPGEIRGLGFDLPKILEQQKKEEDDAADGYSVPAG